MTAPKVAATLLDKLSAEFPGSAIKTRKQAGMDLVYLSIDAVLNRLNEAAGLTWSTEDVTLDVTHNDGKYTAVVSGYLVIGGVRRFGSGADSGGDLDKVVKTAQAEFEKKAAQRFGVGIYLWDADSRDRAKVLKDLSGGSEAALKKAVFGIARERSGKDAPTAKEVADTFGVKPGDLADKATLQKILTAEGLL